MTEPVVTLLINLAAAYLLVGLVVAAVFFSRWMKAIDPSASGGSVGFKVLVTPGVIVLWPVILRMVFRRKSSAAADGAEALRRNHLLAIALLAITGLLLFTAALTWRAPGLEDLPPVEFPTP